MTKMSLIRTTCLTLILIVTRLLIPHNTHAQEEFTKQIDSIYRLSDNAPTTVLHNIELINNLSHIYPTTYNFAVSTGDIKNISINIMGDSVSPQIDQQNATTSIHIPIRTPNIGKGQSTKIEIRYETGSLAERIGDTIALTLPKTAKANEVLSFSRSVYVPNTYPNLSYSSQTLKEQIDSRDQRQYVFEGQGDQNLTLHFGTSANYDLSLNYQLRNNTSISALSELALPPDTGYQRVILNSLEPKPNEIILDSDGNWLARYTLPPLSKLDVVATLTINVSPTPVYYDPSSSTPTNEEPFWEQSSDIKRLATNLKNPENLYNYLLQTLSYDYTEISRQKRLGAAEALNNPHSAICTEFTDLFVATSRAMGIPSRAIIGYALTTSTTLRPQSNELDILHAYPEYQDPSTKVWRSVDPTWGHTSGGSEYFDILDFGHITFVRLGNNSNYPLPAGSYRENRSGKQIKVTPRTQTFSLPPSSYTMETIDGNDYILNTGTAAIVNETVLINERDYLVKYLPPYGRMPIPEHQSNNQTGIYQYRDIILAITLGLCTLLAIFIIWKKTHKK